jgi:hypothetical protein
MMTTELAGQIRELIDAGARPVSLGEITARACARPPRPVVSRQRLRLDWAAAVAVGILAVGGAGAITAAQIATAGHPAAPAARIAAAGHPAAPTAEGAGPLLTTAQVHQVTVASRAALAHSARAYITYGGPGPDHAFQSEYVAFSGRNYSLAGSVINPAAGGRPGQLTWFAERVINGQAYDHELDSRGWHWYHCSGVASGRAVRDLDPRTMLRVLAPGERFRFAGHLIVGGVPLERLWASAPAKVADLGVLAGAGAGESVTALNVLVDSHGVVRQVDISLRGTTLTAAARVRKPATRTGPLAGQGPVPVTAAGLTAITVTFADIGQPQTITVPPHVINVKAPWGVGGHVLPPPVILSAVAGS